MNNNSNSKIIGTSCRMSLMYNAVAEGRKLEIPMDTITPYVIGAEADPNAGKTAWFDFLRYGLFRFDAVRKTPERNGDRDNELWVRRVPIIGKPNSMLFLNMANSEFVREKMSIDEAMSPDIAGVYDRDDLLSFTRQNFADIVFLSNYPHVDADLEIDMTVTRKPWGRSSKLRYNC